MRRAVLTVATAIALALSSASAFARTEAKGHASPATATAAATATTIAPTAAVNERKICKRFDATESRMKSKRLCLTKAQWREFEQDQ